MLEEPEKGGQRIRLLEEGKLWRMKSEQQIIEALKAFTGNNRQIIVAEAFLPEMLTHISSIRRRVIDAHSDLSHHFVWFQNEFAAQLQSMADAMQQTEFLRKNALIGCSLVFVHDGQKAVVRMINFARATPAEDENIGTREGVANLAQILKEKM